MITCLSGLPTSARRIPHTTVRIGYVAVLIGCFGCASDVCEADSTYDGKNRLCSGVNRLFWMCCNDIGGLGGK